jgi:hypothetical protein
MDKMYVGVQGSLITLCVIQGQHVKNSQLICKEAAKNSALQRYGTIHICKNKATNVV